MAAHIAENGGAPYVL